ncbi:MAG: 16S rRNA (cytosine(1402)-N(4))-methyltransferase RsmH [Calditrichaeota bacterium]|nr:MAG: 16S rRNA (cytosine(1402)-N(4))-methyltransferase RsmH [Calditrichota bacterium]
MQTPRFHQPVLVQEVLRYLITRRDGVYLDCTVGGGGHSRYILEALLPEGFLIGLDADVEALQEAGRVLADFPNKLLRQAFSDQLDVVLYETGRYPLDGVLYDLGLSSFQVDVERRGFSFQKEAPLDMRFNPAQKKTAADVVNSYPQAELERILREYGEERLWRRIAAEIVRKRAVAPIQTTTELAEIVRGVAREPYVTKTLARVFQAIRIEVNRELERLKTSLEKAFHFLRQGGRIVVISYHSLEDRVVKEFFRYKAQACVCPPELPACVCGKQAEMKLLTRKVVKPGANEVAANPRARSARLRAAEKIVPFQEAS